MKKITLAMMWALLLTVGACKSGTQAQPEATQQPPAQETGGETEEAPAENQ